MSGDTQAPREGPVQPSLRRLRAHDVRPKRDLGQNFLVDSNILGVIERAAGIGDEHPAIHIGATGTYWNASRSRSFPVRTLNVASASFTAAPLGRPDVLAWLADPRRALPALDREPRFDAALGTPYMQYAGSNNPVLDVPVALLTEDVSASDWLPFGYKGAPGVRIFGPFETNGGFSTRYSFGYWLGMNYVMAVGDSIDPAGNTLNGTGVSPDEIVLPKQSDLLLGKDTVYDAALAWLRTQIP